MEHVSSLGRTAGLSMEAGAPRVRPLVLAPLLMRLGLGVIFFAHGAQKLFGIFGGTGLQATATGFAAMGLRPAFGFALAAGIIEFGGACLLAVGFLTRPAAAVMALEMLFALLTVHLPNGLFLNFACAPGRGHGIEYNLLLVSTLAALALLGPGRASLDGSRTVRKRLGVPFRKREG